MNVLGLSIMGGSLPRAKRRVLFLPIINKQISYIKH